MKLGVLGVRHQPGTPSVLLQDERVWVPCGRGWTD